MNRLLQLRRVPLFSQLSLAPVEEIDRILVEERDLPNEVIYREGDPGDRLYVLAEGGIEVWMLATRVRCADQRFADAVLADGTQVRA